HKSTLFPYTTLFRSRKTRASGKVRERKRIKDKETSMTPVTAAPAEFKLTERINRIEPSATMAVVAEADKLRQQGIDVVDFGAGEDRKSTRLNSSHLV